MRALVIGGDDVAAIARELGEAAVQVPSAQSALARSGESFDTIVVAVAPASADAAALHHAFPRTPVVVIADVAAPIARVVELAAERARLAARIAAVVHDLANPLSVVMANLDLAVQRLDGLDGVPAVALDELNDALECATMMRDLIGDLDRAVR